ncbi:MAG: OmpA family protein [Myxococcaceae bacterium]|nr:OmpA family protein [Myxococcaceae bacterium]
MRRPRFLALLASLGLAAGATEVVVACVGDDAPTSVTTTDLDAAANDGASVVSDAASGADGATLADGSPDASPPACDLTKPFGPMVEIAELTAPDAATGDLGAALSEDELTIWFTSQRGSASETTYTAHRVDMGAAFSNPVPFPIGVNLLFGSFAPDASGIYAGSTNGTLDVSYGPRFDGGYGPFTVVSGIPSSASANEATPFGYSSGSRLYYTALFPSRLVEGRCVGGACTSVRELTELAGGNGFPVASRDDRTLYFASNQGGGAGTDIYRATRATDTDTWGNVTVAVGNPGTDEAPSWVSADGCRLYLSSNKKTNGANSTDIYVVTRPR